MENTSPSPEPPQQTSKLPRTLAVLSVIGLSCLSTLAIDNGLDGQNDILQSIGLEEKHGVDTMSTPSEAGKDTSNVTIAPSLSAASPIAANAQGLPADGSKVDTTGISPGGGLAPENHDWNTMAPMELSIPEVNLVIPIVEKGTIATSDPNVSAMDLPVSYQSGWLNTSAPLNAQKGTTFIAGHVNWVGGGYAPMSNIYNAKPGMIIRTSDAEGHIQKWKVDAHDPKIAQPVKWADLSKNYPITDTDGKRQLVLTTCDDSTDDGVENYDSNYVVTASPITS